MPTVVASSSVNMATTSTSYYLIGASTNKSLDSSQSSTFSVISSPNTSTTGRKSKRPSGSLSGRPFDSAVVRPPSVKFNLQANSVHHVWSRDDLSNENITSQLWYTHREIKFIKSRIQTSIRMMKSGRRFEDGNSDTYCFRGLETEEDKNRRRERVAMLQMALSVCSSAHEFYSTSGISLTLQELSYTAREEAILRATHDQGEALKVYRSAE